MIALQKRIFLVLTLLLFSKFLVSGQSIETPSAPEVFASMKKVADWQMNQSLKHTEYDHRLYDWTMGALYAGFMAHGRIANDDAYFKRMRQYGDDMNWKGGPRRFHADDYCVGQMFAEMYDIYKEPGMIEYMIRLADTIAAKPHTESLAWKKNIASREWAWCDALFMGPPAIAKLTKVTGNQKYIDLTSKLWWRTTDYLYNKNDSLYFRDSTFFTKREKNGKNVYWSRGNGWVMGGLVRTMEVMPENHPDYPGFVQLYKEMAKKIASLQQPDGTWHASLLDPDSYPSKETSGTGFYTYALTWGINKGLLDQSKYFPVVLKAWNALTGAVHPDGKLGYVQPIGAAPDKVTADDTEVYGVGAFLLAGSELLKYLYAEQGNAARLVIINPAGISRTDVTELDFQTIASLISKASTPISSGKKKQKKNSPSINILPDQLVFEDFISGKQLAYQIVNDSVKKSIRILMCTDLAAGTTSYILIKKETPGQFKPRTYGRYVPERSDDFAWENDRIAFRMYGKALEPIDGPSSGVDVWMKHKKDLIIDYMYNRKKPDIYHADRGIAVDCYKVGPTLGAGGIAPFVNGKLVFSKNYRNYKVLMNGPVRTQFELTYDPWEVNGKMITETKRITIDAGQYLSRFESIYSGFSDSMTVATGIVKHPSPGKFFFDETKSVVTYWDVADKLPEEPANGFIGIGTLVPAGAFAMNFAANHALTFAKVTADKPFIYYAGAGWNKADFKSESDWQKYMQDFRIQLDNPLKMNFQ